MFCLKFRLIVTFSSHFNENWSLANTFEVTLKFFLALMFLSLRLNRSCTLVNIRVNPNPGLVQFIHSFLRPPATLRAPDNKFRSSRRLDGMSFFPANFSVFNPALCEMRLPDQQGKLCNTLTQLHVS